MYSTLCNNSTTIQIRRNRTERVEQQGELRRKWESRPQSSWSWLLLPSSLEKKKKRGMCSFILRRHPNCLDMHWNECDNSFTWLDKKIRTAVKPSLKLHSSIKIKKRRFIKFLMSEKNEQLLIQPVHESREHCRHIIRSYKKNGLKGISSPLLAQW